MDEKKLCSTALHLQQRVKKKVIPIHFFIPETLLSITYGKQSP